MTRVQERNENAVFQQVFCAGAQAPAGVEEGVVSLMVAAEVVKACRGLEDPQYHNSCELHYEQPWQK